MENSVSVLRLAAPVRRKIAVSTAFRISVAQSLRTLSRAAAKVDRATIAHALLLAAISQSEGDVGGAIRILERALAKSGDGDRDYVVEVLGPLYVSTDKLVKLMELLRTRAYLPALALSRETLLCVLGARQDRAGVPAELQRRVADEEDDLLRARWQQRLAMAAYYCDDFEAASELALTSVQGYTLAGSGRGLAAAYSLLYAINYVATGDIELALRYASLQERHARRCGNESLAVAALVARYELSAELGDREAVSALRRKVRERPLPEQYRERFAKSIADVLWLLWSGDFVAACGSLARLRTGADRALEEQALCSALLALAQAALSDLSAARRSSRRALAAIPDQRMSAGQRADSRRYLTLARALAAAACLLIDDSVRGRRVFDTRSLWNDSSFRCLEDVADGTDWLTASERTRGFARAVATVRDVVRAQQFPPLTSAERLILTLIADGKSAPDIAKDLGRSPNTVRAHTRSIIAKLNVSGRLAAVAEARRLGVVS